MLSHTRFTVAVLLLAGCATLRAQTAPRVDLAASFVAERSIQANTAASFWAEGGSLELGANAFRGLDLAASVTGVHTGSVGAGGVPLSLVTATFGPRYRWHADRRVSPYGEALLGEANGFRSLFPAGSGADTSASSMAFQAGGGVDLRVSERFAVRALEASWLRTQLPNGTNNRQNSLRLGAGIALRFGARAKD